MAHRSRRTWLPALAALLLGASVLVALFLRPRATSLLTGQSGRSTNALLVHRVEAERLSLGTDDGASRASTAAVAGGGPVSTGGSHRADAVEGWNGLGGRARVPRP